MLAGNNVFVMNIEREDLPRIRGNGNELEGQRKTERGDTEGKVGEGRQEGQHDSDTEQGVYIYVDGSHPTVAT